MDYMPDRCVNKLNVLNTRQLLEMTEIVAIEAVHYYFNFDSSPSTLSLLI